MQTNFMQTKIKYDSSIFKEWSENWFDEVKVITLLWQLDCIKIRRVK